MISRIHCYISTYWRCSIFTNKDCSNFIISRCNIDYGHPSPSAKTPLYHAGKAYLQVASYDTLKIEFSIICNWLNTGVIPTDGCSVPLLWNICPQILKHDGPHPGGNVKFAPMDANANAPL